MKDFGRLIQQCETWIRAGETAKCVAALNEYIARRVPSNYRRELAAIARRIGQPQTGLRLLSPLFRAGFEGARPADLAEYAVLLQRCGANREAMQLLESVDEEVVPEASLYKSFAHFNLWEYEQAIPHLVKFTGAKITPYWRLVGRVNLADAFLFTERFEAAEDLLGELATELKALKHFRLLGNCYEMLGQLYILRGDFSRAGEPLGRAADLLGQTGALDRFYVSRWQSVLDSFKAKSTDGLVRFRAQALNKGEFESVRQVDFFRLKISFDENLFHHLYAGTPYESYRAKLARAFNVNPTNETYLWGPAEGRRFNIDSAALDGKVADIKGRKCHGLLRELSLDFYKPKRTAEIFSGLWPQEHYNVFSSPQRVHQAVARTRQWLKEQNLDLDLTKSKFGYRIDFGATTALEVQSSPGPALAYERFLYDLRRGSPEGFTSETARRNLDLSASAFRRFCSWAINHGRLQKWGAGPHTRYVFAA